MEKSQGVKTPAFATPRNDLAGLENFTRISDALYRGQQPTAEGFATLKKMGIKTIVNLRSFNSDKKKMRGNGLQYFHIWSKAWRPTDKDVVKFLQIVRDPKNHPVFVHCQHGADRTGMMSAMYRIFHQDWSTEHAAKELHNFGFHKIWKMIERYLKAVDREKIEKLIAKSKPLKVRVIK